MLSVSVEQDQDLCTAVSRQQLKDEGQAALRFGPGSFWQEAEVGQAQVSACPWFRCRRAESAAAVGQRPAGTPAHPEGAAGK